MIDELVWRNPIKVLEKWDIFRKNTKRIVMQKTVWLLIYFKSYFHKYYKEKYKKPSTYVIVVICKRFKYTVLHLRPSWMIVVSTQKSSFSILFFFFFTPIHQLSFYISRSVRVSITPSAILNDLCNSCLCGADLHVHFTTETLWGSANYRLLSNNCTFCLWAPIC